MCKFCFRRNPFGAIDCYFTAKANRGQLVSVIVTKWFSLPRLETRTKESNVHASVRVTNPTRNESTIGWTRKGHNLPASILREKGLSVSIHVGTRKMVNYA